LISSSVDHGIIVDAADGNGYGSRIAASTAVTDRDGAPSRSNELNDDNPGR
jgi:hypothetical protein